MFVWELEVGGLYTTNRRDAVELYSQPHVVADEGNLESTLGSILYKDDYFVVLEVQLIHKTYWCLKLLTSRGIMGWTARLHYNHYNNEWDRVQFEKVEA